MEDRDLIEQYAQRGSETAFTTLVNRYLGLVYSAALRRVSDVQAAREIAQTVFCLLARKARQLPPDTPLAGWLHRTVCFTAAKHWRAESRRRHREQQAASSMISNESANDTTWDELAPHLDDAVTELPEPDRLAILLRFFQDKAFPEVGQALGISEDAARMRVNRALDKLRALLSSRNITCSSAALGALLVGNTMATVPAAAATAIRVAALEAAKAVGAPSILGAVLALMARAKVESAAIAGLIILTGVGIALRLHNKSEGRASATPPATVAGSNSATTTDAAAQTAPTFGLVRNSRARPAGVPANPDDRLTARQLYERGQTHQREKRYDEALADYTQGIELLESGGERWQWFTELYFARASLYADLKDYRKAIADYGRMLEYVPTDYSSRFNRALYHTYERQYDQALADYTAIIEGDTDFSKHLDGREKCLAHTYHYRGRAYQDVRDYAKAIEDYTSAVAIENAGDIDELYWRRALCHKALGQTDQAMADASFLAEQAWKIATSPTSTSKQISLASHMGRFSSEVFNHTVPDHLEAAAAIYARKGEFKQAVWYQKKALNLLDPSTSAEVRAAVQSRLNLYESRKTLLSQ